MRLSATSLSFSWLSFPLFLKVRLSNEKKKRNRQQTILPSQQKDAKKHARKASLEHVVRAAFWRSPSRGIMSDPI
jgi:hypothetical protein